MNYIVVGLSDLLKTMVPRAGIEPALPSEPHFECGASTSSANGARITRDEAITRAFEEDKMSQTNMKSGPGMDPVDYKVETSVAHGERPSFDQKVSHSKPIQLDVDSGWLAPSGPLSTEEYLAITDNVDAMRWRLQGILHRLKLPGNLKVQFMYHARGYFYAQVYEVDAIDNVTGEFITWQGRKWLLSEHMTDAEIVQTVFKAVMTAVEHEVRETFLYKGQSVFDPHYDLEKLVELRMEKDALVKRA